MESERSRQTQEPIIRSIRRYIGTAHRWAIDWPVVIASVLRDGQVLADDAKIGTLRPDDWIEFAPLIGEAEGAVRTSWVLPDARPRDLGLVEGVYPGPMPDTLVLEALPPPERNSRAARLWV